MVTRIWLQNNFLLSSRCGLCFCKDKTQTKINHRSESGMLGKPQEKQVNIKEELQFPRRNGYSILFNTLLSQKGKRGLRTHQVKRNSVFKKGNVNKLPKHLKHDILSGSGAQGLSGQVSKSLKPY